VKTKRLMIFGVLAALAIASIISIIPSVRRHSEYNEIVKALQSLPKDRIEKAIQAFVHEQRIGGKPVPDTVPPRELASGGRLRTEEIQGLEGRNVSVSLAGDETTPQLIRICVSSSDSAEIVLKADGSISMISMSPKR